MFLEKTRSIILSLFGAVRCTSLALALGILCTNLDAAVDAGRALLCTNRVLEGGGETQEAGPRPKGSRCPLIIIGGRGVRGPRVRDQKVRRVTRYTVRRVTR